LGEEDEYADGYTRSRLQEFQRLLALFIALAALVAIPVLISYAPRNEMGDKDVPVLLVIGSALVFVLMLKGLYMLQPNQSALMMLFGSYRGTDYATGLRWANPFLNKTKVSLRLRNFNSEKLKVNDKRGNPIEIAAAIVWKVSDTARAVLDIDTTSSTCRSRPKRRCATWPTNIRTTTSTRRTAR
jgi:hypothetical protein